MSRQLAPLKPARGRRPKHAGRLLDRVLKENRLDRRTQTARMLDSVANDLAAERGGWQRVSAGEEIAIRRIAFLTLLCSSIESWALQQPGGVIAEGKLLGPLAKGYATHQANLVRTLAVVGIRPDRQPEQSLTDYLRQREIATEPAHSPAGGVGGESAGRRSGLGFDGPSPSPPNSPPAPPPAPPPTAPSRARKDD